MERDGLNNLIEAADGAVKGPHLDGLLGAKVRRRARRRARVFSMAAGFVLAAAGVTTFFMLQRISDGPAAKDVAAGPSLRDGNLDEKDLRAELARLNAEADSRARMVARIYESERAARRRALANAALSRAAPLEELVTERERAAAMLVEYGDRMRAQAGGADEAARSYQCVVAHFSGSALAAVARERLGK